MAQASVAPSAGANGNGPQPQSFIRIHSDSQQSLDQLFNPTQNTVPLRNRNLPLSFFNPSVRNDIMESSNSANDDQSSPRATGFHHRSVSFDHNHQNHSSAGGQIAHSRPVNSFHQRTHSTLAPMPRLLSNNSSHQSSHEFISQEVSSPSQEQAFVADSSSHQLNRQPNLHHHSHSNSGWSSAANSTDNLSSPSWAASQPSLSAHTVPNHQTIPAPTHQQQQQPMQLGQDGVTSGSMLQQHEPIMSPAHSHQNIFYSSNGNHHHHHHQHSNSTAHPAMAQQLANTHNCSGNLHTRSMSFNPHQSSDMHAHQAHHHGFHARTHSTVGPISSPTMAPCNQHAISNHSLHGSSQELNYQSNTIHTSSATGWSSSGYSTDDTTASSRQNWPAAGQAQQQQQPMVAQTNLQQAVTPTHSLKPAMPNQLHNHHHPHDPRLHHHHHHMQAQASHQPTHQPQQQLYYHV